MKKTYAVLKPAFSFTEGDLSNLPYPAVALFHLCWYERVCGYSLGHPVHFYDSLDDAKKAAMFSDKAIAELNIDEDVITGFCTLYKAGIMQKRYKQLNNSRFFEKIYTQIWHEQPISPSDLSQNALTEINRHYQEQIQSINKASYYSV